MPDEIIWKSKN